VSFTRKSSRPDAPRRPRGVLYAGLFLAGSVVFTAIAAVVFFTTEDDRQGPDPYAQENLAILKKDPLVNLSSEGFSLTSQSEEIGLYICMICDYFGTGINQSFELRQEPSRAFGTIERTAQRSGWTVVGRQCPSDQGGATLTLKKNFADAHAEATFQIFIGKDLVPPQGSMISMVDIEHGTSRIRAGQQMDRLDCLDDEWRQGSL